MELTYVLSYFDLNEERGRAVTCAAGSDYIYLKNEALEQSNYNTDVNYSIEFYATTDTIRCELVRTEVYHNGELKETYDQPIIELLGFVK